MVPKLRVKGMWERAAVYTSGPSSPSGMYGAPALSAQPGPSVSPGENVTLQCRSEVGFDNFHLLKEGSPAPPQHLRLRDTAAPSQANFTISPVTSAHEGTYRCYGSRSTYPYLLSHASDPLQLVVSGEGPQPLSVERPDSQLTVQPQRSSALGGKEGETGRSRQRGPSPWRDGKGGSLLPYDASPHLGSRLCWVCTGNSLKSQWANFGKKKWD